MCLCFIYCSFSHTYVLHALTSHSHIIYHIDASLSVCMCVIRRPVRHLLLHFALVYFFLPIYHIVSMACECECIRIYI